MPKKSPDDSKIRINTENSDNNSDSNNESNPGWNELGLWTELTDCLVTDMKLEAPTAVQQFVIPELLQLSKNQQQHPQQSQHSTTPLRQEHVAFLAATGSGKTLAYAIPLMQWLKHEEMHVLPVSTGNTTNAATHKGLPGTTPEPTSHHGKG